MAAKSQELISKLLAAEDQAEKIISEARSQRTQKLKDVRGAAESELEPFKMKEEQKFRQDQLEASNAAGKSAELEAQTQRELTAVKSDFENNKKQAAKFILDKVLDSGFGCCVNSSLCFHLAGVHVGFSVPGRFLSGMTGGKKTFTPADRMQSGVGLSPQRFA